jgi:hypothetical protein
MRHQADASRSTRYLTVNIGRVETRTSGSGNEACILRRIARSQYLPFLISSVLALVLQSLVRVIACKLIPSTVSFWVAYPVTQQPVVLCSLCNAALPKLQTVTVCDMMQSLTVTRQPFNR